MWNNGQWKVPQLVLTQMCTMYDIELNIPELYSRDNDEFTEPIGQILNSIRVQSSVLIQRFSQYFSYLASPTPILTYPVSRKGNSSNNSYLKPPVLLITDSTNTEADTVVVTFQDATNYNISNFYGSISGSGNIKADYTDPNDLFLIPAVNWIGTFSAGDKFYFAYETFEDILRLICSYKVAEQILRGRYVSEAANQMQTLTTDYGAEADKMIDAIEKGYIQLACKRFNEGQPPSSQEPWQGYNIDRFGIAENKYNNVNPLDRLSGFADGLDRPGEGFLNGIL